MLIQAALNGRRTRAEHPAIPIAPAELATSAKESVDAGATSIHFHVRAADGQESLDPQDVAKALTAINVAIPGTQVGVSTGAWILRNAKLRQEVVSHWTIVPDFASVNFNEDGATALAEFLLSQGIGVEAGLSDLKGTHAFVASGLAPRCLRLLLEPFEVSTASALETLKAVEAALDAPSLKLPRLLHGVNATAWELIDEAAARGYDTRIGFEDILALPSGEQAGTNAALVSAARSRMRSSSRA